MSPSRWLFPDPTNAPSDLVTVGGDLAVDTLLDAYVSGYFPMPLAQKWARGTRGRIGWYSPNPRGVLVPDDLRISRSLRRSMGTFEVSINTEFDEVVRHCADPSRPHGWIDSDIATAYSALHRSGWAHSIEIRRHGDLVGGLYGVAIANLFAGESMFHTATDASKVALVHLVSLLGPEALIDVQWQTPHLRSLGVTEVTRSEYLRRLRLAVSVIEPNERFAR